ncbi:hypothetical protein H3C66_05025 [Patescibacteria group bacterium]|jgi:hypothetical protein|nr:hypothetical protein [Patescibacteria group bacterium]
MKKQTRLSQAFSSYQKKKNTKQSLLRAFVRTMPEIILRTTKLEGEPVSRKMVQALFK